MKTEHELTQEIEQVKHAIEVNESFDLPTDSLYAILKQKEDELKDLSLPVEKKEEPMMSPFCRDNGSTVKNCYVECAKAIENLGLGSMGHCSGCHLSCKCLRVDSNVVIVKRDSEGIWIRIKEVT